MGKRKLVSDEGSRRFYFIANAWGWLTPYVHGVHRRLWSVITSTATTGT